jgi:hypothetical protein
LAGAGLASWLMLMLVLLVSFLPFGYTFWYSVSTPELLVVALH